jgi:hypothetical protein
LSYKTWLEMPRVPDDCHSFDDNFLFGKTRKMREEPIQQSERPWIVQSPESDFIRMEYASRSQAYNEALNRAIANPGSSWVVKYGILGKDQLTFRTNLIFVNTNNGKVLRILVDNAIAFVDTIWERNAVYEESEQSNHSA